MSAVNRRGFLGRAAVSSASTASRAAVAAAAEEKAKPAEVKEKPAESAGRKIVVGVMGTGGRGTQRGEDVLRLRDRTSRWPTCATWTPDRWPRQAAADAGKVAKVVGDFRRILDDKAVDVLSIAAPNHWHAPAAILACSAGKHVYVEKPGSHNPREGELRSPPPASATASCRWATSGGAGRTSSRRSRSCATAPSAASASPAAWYTNAPPDDRRGQAGPGARVAGLRAVAGARPAAAVSAATTCTTTGTGSGTGATANSATTASTRSTSGPLGPGRRLSRGASLSRRPLPLRGRPGDAGHARRQLRLRRQAMITWEGLSCQPAASRAKASASASTAKTARWSSTATGAAIFDLQGQGSRRAERPAAATRTSPTSSRHPLRQAAQQRDRGGAQEHAALPPRQHRPPHRPDADCDPNNGRILNDPEAMKHWSREYAPGWEPKV